VLEGKVGDKARQLEGKLEAAAKQQRKGKLSFKPPFGRPQKGNEEAQGTAKRKSIWAADQDEAASQLQGLMGDLDAAVAQAQAGRAPVQPAPAARPDAGRGPGEDGPGVVLVVALP
jgi:hypothetical protein